MPALPNTTPDQIVSPKTDLVLFDGNVELLPGTLVCYENDYATTSTDPDETAAGKFGGRSRHVALPSATNCDSVAGWTIAKHSASSSSVKIEIALAEPGNCCLARVETASTINTSFFTPSISPGAVGVAYRDGKIPGRGRVRALQTVVVKASRTDITPGPVYDATDGGLRADDSYGAITIAGVLTDTAAFTYATVGDRVIILGAATAAGAVITDGADPITGEYKIGTWTSANVVTLLNTDGSAFVGDATARISYYVVRGHPTIPVRCDSDSRESGLCEFIQPLASTAVSPTALVGTTFGAGGILTAATSTGTLADGVNPGQRKRIEQLGKLTTNGHVITITNAVANNGLVANALSTMTNATIGNSLVLEWVDADWVLQNWNTTTLG